jgi:hypothetical protein
MDSSQSGSRKRAKTGRESGTSSSTRRTSAYDPAFEQHLNDHGIYKTNRAQKPSNWAEINKRLAQPRPSLSPSQFTEAAFEAFQRTNEDALTEATVMSKAFPIIAGTPDIPSQENLLFGNLKHLTDGSITKAKPDFYDGSRPADLDKRIREELGPYIVPSTNTAAPCVPNFYTEGKGPKGDTSVCRNQALYNGALGARGMHILRSHVDPETAYDNNAYTITSTYHGGAGVLKLFTTHPIPSTNPKIPVEYCMTQLKGWDITGDPDTFRQGASALRNARDWAREERRELITAVNDKMLDMEHQGLDLSGGSFLSQSTNESPFTDEIVDGESETSADELGLDTQSDDTPAYRTPIGVRTDHPPKGSSHRCFKKKALRANKRPRRGSRNF